jgi:hypothetical protein
MRPWKVRYAAAALVTRIFGLSLRLLFMFLAAAHLTPPVAVLAQRHVHVDASFAAKSGEDNAVRPFRVHVPQPALNDLRRRLAATL